MRSALNVALGLLAAGLGQQSEAKTVIAPAPEGIPACPDWTVRVDGQPVPVFSVTVFRGGPAFFCDFETDGPAHIEALPNWPVREAVVRPLARGIKPAIDRDVISFDIAGPCFLSVEPNHLTTHPLFVFADPLDKEPLAAGEANVLYFGPGIHILDKPVVLAAGQEVYIARGAWLKAVMPKDEKPVTRNEAHSRPRYQPLFHAPSADGVVIRGRGVIDLSGLDWNARCAIHLNGGRNIRIEGVTILDGPSWTVLVSQCEDVRIENIKLVGHRESNDGINLVNSRRAVVRDCFLRVGDDGVVMKTSPNAGETHDVLVERCVIWNDKVRCIGVTSFAAEPIRDVTFRDIDIIHDLTTDFLEASTMAIWLEDRGPVSNIVFDDIRCEDVRGKLIQIRITKGRWSVTDELGPVEQIAFRNIQCLGANKPQSLILGNDPVNCVRDVRFVNLTMNGETVRNPQDANLTVNDYVYDLEFGGDGE